MPYTRIKPYNWPQDSLDIPNGIGSMPPIEFGNRSVTGQEYFSLSATFDILANTPAHTIATQFIATPQDGDFWCDQIGCIAWVYIDAVQGQDIIPGAMITVRDVRTGRSLFYNPPFNTPVNPGQLFPADSVPLAIFRKFPSTPFPLPSYDGTFPIPASLRDTGTLIQPYCFTRQGGIRMSLTNLYAIPNNFAKYSVTVIFSGWKEYANASG